MSQNEQKPIPIPYRVLSGAIVTDGINDYGNFIVVACERELTPQDEATLKFIARACNAHAALLKSCKVALERLNAANLSRNPKQGHFMVSDIEAAIAQAEHES